MAKFENNIIYIGEKLTKKNEMFQINRKQNKIQKIQGSNIGWYQNRCKKA